MSISEQTPQSALTAILSFDGDFNDCLRDPEVLFGWSVNVWDRMQQPVAIFAAFPGSVNLVVAHKDVLNYDELANVICRETGLRKKPNVDQRSLSGSSSAQEVFLSVPPTAIVNLNMFVEFFSLLNQPTPIRAPPRSWIHRTHETHPRLYGSPGVSVAELHTSEDLPASRVWTEEDDALLESLLTNGSHTIEDAYGMHVSTSLGYAGECPQFILEYDETVTHPPPFPAEWQRASSELGVKLLVRQT